MLRRFLSVGAPKTFRRRYFSTASSTVSSTLVYQRKMDYVLITSDSSLELLNNTKAPQKDEELEGLAANSKWIRDVGKYILIDNRKMNATLYANDPGKEVGGHRYGAISNRYTLSKIALQQATDLGDQNIRRLLAHCMVNGTTEYPGSDKARIEKAYQASGKVSLEIPSSHADNWKNKATIDSVIHLGAASYITMKAYPVVQDEDMTILPMLATTLQPHIFSGRALWLPMLNRKLSEFRFVVLGVGQAPLVILDTMNNPTAGLLWDTMAESAVYLLDNHASLEKETPGYITRLREPKIAKQVWSGLPNDTQWSRYFLSSADSLSSSVISAKWALGNFYGYQPPASDVQAVEKVLKETPKPPEQPLVEEREAQELTEDTSSDESEKS